MLWVFAIDGKVDEGGMYNAQVIENMLPAQACSVDAHCLDSRLYLPIVGGGDGAADDELPLQTTNSRIRSLASRTPSPPARSPTPASVTSAITAPARGARSLRDEAQRPTLLETVIRIRPAAAALL